MRELKKDVSDAKLPSGCQGTRFGPSWSCQFELVVQKPALQLNSRPTSERASQRSRHSLARARTQLEAAGGKAESLSATTLCTLDGASVRVCIATLFIYVFNSPCGAPHPPIRLDVHV